MKVMILAAGEGTRFRPHTLTLPKPAIPFLGVPLAFHSLGLFDKLETLELVVNTYHLPAKIKQTYLSIESKVQSLQFSDEAGTILGSGGGLKKAQSLIQATEPFFMMNADEVILPAYSQILEKAYQHHLKSKNISTLLVMKHPLVGTKFGGVWTENDSVIGFGKSAPRKESQAWHFLGIQILSPDVFNFVPENKESNILYDGLTQALQDGQHVGFYEVDALWFETGNPLDFLQATKECLEHIKNQDTYGKSIQQTISKFSEEKFHLLQQDTSLCLAAESSLSKISELSYQGFNVIGQNLTCHGPVQIQNSVIGNNQSLLPGEKVSDSILI